MSFLDSVVQKAEKELIKQKIRDVTGEKRCDRVCEDDRSTFIAQPEITAFDWSLE